MVDLPIDGAPLAQGLGYRHDTAPTTDAADLDGLTAQDSAFKSVGTAPPSDFDKPSPLDPMSIPTKMEAAPVSGAFLQSNLHRDYWCDYMLPNVGDTNR